MGFRTGTCLRPATAARKCSARFTPVTRYHTKTGLPFVCCKKKTTPAKRKEYKGHCKKAKYKTRGEGGHRLRMNETHFWNRYHKCWIKRRVPARRVLAPRRRPKRKPGRKPKSKVRRPKRKSTSKVTPAVTRARAQRRKPKGKGPRPGHKASIQGWYYPKTWYKQPPKEDYVLAKYTAKIKQKWRDTHTKMGYPKA